MSILNNSGLILPLLRGDIYEVNLDPVLGSEIGKIRPAVIIQNNIGNQHSSITIIAPISSVKAGFKLLPIMTLLKKGEGGLSVESFVHCGQIRSLDKTQRLINKLGTLSLDRMKEIDNAICISLALK